MLTRAIPSTGERVPAIGLGTWQTFDRPADDSAATRELAESLRMLRDAGGSIIDTSPMYGRAEQTLGELARRAGVVDELFVATKVWTRGERAGIDEMERSMRLLHRPTIDLMQIHNLLDWRTHLKTLRRWKDEGRIRYIGITHYTASAYPDLEAVLEREPIDFVQLAYSPRYRHAERSLLPLAAERGVAVLVNRPFEEGGALRALRGRTLPKSVAEYASSWAEAMLKFILAHPAVTAIVPATRSSAHMAENLAAGSGRLPSDVERRDLVNLLGS